MKIKKINNTSIKYGNIYGSGEWDNIDKTINAMNIESFESLLSEIEVGASNEYVNTLSESLQTSIDNINTRIKQYHPTIITFTLGGETFQAEEGMTWSEWINTGYNTDAWTINTNLNRIILYKLSGGSVIDNYIYYGSNTNYVAPTDIIIADATYGIFEER